MASGAAGELHDLRESCAEALRRVLASGPDLVCVVGAGPEQRWYGDGAGGSLRAYGVPVDVALHGAVDRPPTMPLSLTVGAWLLNRTGWPGERRAVAVPAGAADAELARLAEQVLHLAPTVALMVMADGSARHTEKAPGYVDPRAPAFDAAIAGALAGGDPAALADMDQRLGDELLAAGTASLRLLGQAAAALQWDAALLSESAPYGVGYFAAAWTPRR